MERLIDQSRMLAEFLELVQIRSQGKKERRIIDLLKERLTEMGAADVYEDECFTRFGGDAGNIFAYFKGNVAGAPVLMLNAHVDTVEPSDGVKPKITDGVITSSGNTILGADDKAGVSSILEAVRTVREKNLPHGNLQVVLTVAEDAGLFGSRFIDQERLRKADFGFSFDGTGKPGSIFYNGTGTNLVDIVIHGRAAHAGYFPERGINAIAIAGKAIAKLKQGRIDEETTTNLGVISGGNAVNVVPDRCEMHGAVRSLDEAKLARETEYMASVFKETAAAEGGKCEVTTRTLFSQFKLDVDSLPVWLAQQAWSRVGVKTELLRSSGGSDANFFNAYGVPTLVVPVGNEKAHELDESIDEAVLYNAGDFTVNLIQLAAGSAK